jgi:FkbM family methyltransferase
MKMFDDKVVVREDNIDGMSRWLWPATDSGAWDGPSMEWVTTHRDGYLKYCKKFDVVVQAGGNCGLYPALLSNHFSRVYTFEPDALNFHCLVHNCQSPNIFKFNAALGETNKQLFLYQSDGSNVGMHVVSDNPEKYSSPRVSHIPTFTIDQLVLDTCDLIQLDCEGYEPNIILGALETIEKFKPVIVLETINRETDVILAQYGYKYKLSVGADKIFAVD